MRYKIRPRGKETTEVRKSQNKGKESENSYQELKRKNTRKLYRDISTGTAVCFCVPIPRRSLQFLVRDIKSCS